MKKRVLVVDDDEMIRRVVVRVLRLAGFEVASCEGGAEALSLLGASPFDVMVTDLVMGGMSGVDLVRQVRTSFPTVRCVVMSGQLEPAEGVDGAVWVDKPLRRDALLEAIGG